MRQVSSEFESKQMQHPAEVDVVSKNTFGMARSVAQLMIFSALATIAALGAGCERDRVAEQQFQAFSRSRSQALDVCDALESGGSAKDAALCAQGVLGAKRYAETAIPAQTQTRKHGDVTQTGIEVRSIERYRLELSPTCFLAASRPEFADVKDAFEVCMAGALDFYSRAALNVCGVDILKLTGAETEFCVLRTASARRVFVPIYRR
jgi:hypothetical protein